MKRLLGLIGLTYLSVLVIVFYFYNEVVIWSLISIATLLVVVSLFFKVNKINKNFLNILITIGITSLCSIVAIILYTNIKCNPVVINYSDKEINVTGYICEEPTKTETSCSYLLQTDTINDEEVKTKIALISYSDLSFEEFDRVEGSLTVAQNDNTYYISKGVFLKSYDGDFELNSLNEKQFSVYSYAVSVRKALKSSLDNLFSPTVSSLCKAVMLGDRQSLSSEIKEAFSSTGSSFLIVVSGMHLAIATGFIVFLLKKIKCSKLLISLIAIAVVLAYCALTGFSSSVVRAGVMVILTNCATILFRKADSLNSLGVSALVLTLLNPFAVGDIGMLLSFSATLGIILWAEPINSYLTQRLRLKRIIPKTLSQMFSVSLSASIWVIPISMIYFGRISILVVIISMICEHPVSLILICSLVASLLYICPFISILSYPFAFVAGVSSRIVLWVVTSFARVPFCSVNAEKIYFYIWLCVSVLFVIIGYIIKPSRFYVKVCTAISVIVLAVGWAVASIIGYSTTTFTTYYSGGGIVAQVENGFDVSLLSCGGTNYYKEDLVDSATKNYSSVNSAIILNTKNKYSGYLPKYLEEFDDFDILIYDSDTKALEQLESYDGVKRMTFGEKESFTVELFQDIYDTVYGLKSGAVQFINSDSTTILILPSDTDISDLPQNARSADYVIADSLPKNSDLLSCGSIVYCGTEKYFEKHKDEFSEISNDILKLYKINNVQINLSGGSNGSD